MLSDALSPSDAVCRGLGCHSAVMQQGPRNLRPIAEHAAINTPRRHGDMAKIYVF